MTGHKHYCAGAIIGYMHVYVGEAGVRLHSLPAGEVVNVFGEQ